ncbi:MAG: hypothetical protein ACJA0U_000188 [Salibacteraceae bacterium]|jgi:hypothetical protein
MDVQESIYQHATLKLSSEHFFPLAYNKDLSDEYSILYIGCLDFALDEALQLFVSFLLYSFPPDKV